MAWQGIPHHLESLEDQCDSLRIQNDHLLAENFNLQERLQQVLARLHEYESKETVRTVIDSQGFKT